MHKYKATIQEIFGFHSRIHGFHGAGIAVSLGRYMQTADAKTTEFVIRMLKKNYSCDEIVELAGTTKDNIIRIAQLNKLAYN